MSGSLTRGRCSANWSQIVAKQIERQAGSGHPHQIAVPALYVVQLPRTQPAIGFGRMVEEVIELLDLHRIAV